MQHRKLYAGLGGMVLAGTVAVAGIQASSATESARPAAAPGGVHLKADLDSLNDSGASGHVHAQFKGRKAEVRINARGLAKNLPHAQHLHFGAEARNECPNVFDDANNDLRINVAEGVPDYGPVIVNLGNFATTTGSIDETLVFPNFTQSVLPLDKRAIVLHGMTGPNGYDASIPIVCGQLHAMGNG